MIYNSNGDNTPYQTGGNAKVNKQLKALEEAINNVSGSLTDYEASNDIAVEELRDDVDGLETVAVNDGRRIDLLEETVGDLSVKVQTVDLTATNGDFHKVVAGKYVFQNGYSITGTSICKINNGSVVYATDGTNSVLIDYTDKDAWVAKAKVEDGEHFSIYSNGVLTFTQSGGWSVYVIGNDFDTDTSIPEETPVNIETGVTIGGNLYAALGREYDFDSITSDEASIRIATITGNVSAPNADIDKIDSDEITVADLTATVADIESLNNSKRNFKGYKSISTHQTNLVQFIRIPRFTGTYNLRLVKNVNGADTDLFTATIIWNGHDPIVQYKEYSDNEALDYLYSIILTEHNLYFVTQGDGRLYYGWDAFDAQVPDNSLVFPFVASIPSNILAEGLRAEYITRFHNRTVFFGNHTNASGVDVLGQITADEISGPEKKDINYRGKTTVADLATLDAEPGDIYTVTDNGYTTNRFVEGAGKPINAGDDVMMVEVTSEAELERIEGITELVKSSIATDDGAVLLFPQRENGAGGAPTVQKIYKYDGNTLTDVDVTVDNFWSYGFYSNPIKTPTGRIIVFNYGGNGIYGEQRQPIAIYSDDNGATWNVSYTNGDYTYVGVNSKSAATVAPDGTIYVIGNFGFQKSTDNGTTFTSVVSEDDIWLQMILALQDGSLLAYAPAPGGNSSLLYRSTNAGLNWTQIYTTDGIDYLYQFSNGIITIGPKYSTDNGETWQEISGQYPFEPSFVELDSLIYSGDGLRSTNGASWESYVAISNYSTVAELNDSTLVYSGAIYDQATNYYFPATYNIKPVKTLKWDKFAAGVNYENFVAQNITATGNLEVDGTSQFDDDVTVNADLNADKIITPDLEVTDVITADSTGVNVTADVTHTGNYTATGNQTITGNLTRTGNESVDGNATISGVVIIGELD